MNIKTFRVFLPDRTDVDGGAWINESVLVTAPGISVKDGVLVFWSDDSSRIRQAFAPGYWKAVEEVSA